MAPISVQNGDAPTNDAQEKYEVEQILLGDPSEFCSSPKNWLRKVTDDREREQETAPCMYWCWRQRHYDGVSDPEELGELRAQHL